MSNTHTGPKPHDWDKGNYTVSVQNVLDVWLLKVTVTFSLSKKARTITSPPLSVAFSYPVWLSREIASSYFPFATETLTELSLPVYTIREKVESLSSASLRISILAPGAGTGAQRTVKKPSSSVAPSPIRSQYLSWSTRKNTSVSPGSVSVWVWHARGDAEQPANARAAMQEKS